MLWVCAACTTKYSVGAPRCPHCGSTELEDDMPKITVHGGPSHEGFDGEPEVAGAPGTDGPTVDEGAGETAADLGSSDNGPRKAPAKKAAAKAAAK